MSDDILPPGPRAKREYDSIRCPATHILTGVAACQDAKSQHENKANALKCCDLPYDRLLQEQLEKEGERLAKIGHGDCSEKIRTYNYPNRL